MCYQLVEVYSACKCLYYQHAVDRCVLYPNHNIQQRTILVGYACASHDPSNGYGNRQTPYDDQPTYSDSGYGSGRSHKKSHRQGR